MKNEIKLIDGIYDIISPVEPALSNYEYAIQGILIIICCAIIIYIINNFTAIKSICTHQKIKSLKAAYNNKQINTHDAAFHLSSLLCYGLKLKRICPKNSLPVKISAHQLRWNKFCNNLSLLRYSKTSGYSVDLNDVFDESLFWLKVWR